MTLCLSVILAAIMFYVLPDVCKPTKTRLRSQEVSLVLYKHIRSSLLQIWNQQLVDEMHYLLWSFDSKSNGFIQVTLFNMVESTKVHSFIQTMFFYGLKVKIAAFYKCYKCITCFYIWYTYSYLNVSHSLYSYSVLFSPRLHLFDQKSSSNILNY